MWRDLRTSKRITMTCRRRGKRRSFGPPVIPGEANALALLGMLLEDLGDLARATHSRKKLWRSFGCWVTGTAWPDCSIAGVLPPTMWGTTTLHLAQESLSLARSHGAWHAVALALNNLALVVQERRDFAQAMSLQAKHWTSGRISAI